MNVTATTGNYGQEAMIASLGKKRQEAEGAAALQLLQSVPQPVQAVSQSVAQGSAGTHIDLYV